MNFRPELAAAVMAGTKTVTRRACSPNPRSPWYRERCALVEGRDYSVCPGRGKVQIGRILIVSTTRELFDPAAIDDAEAILEGFGGGSPGDAPWALFRQTWRDLHGDLTPVECWRIEFKVKQ